MVFETDAKKIKDGMTFFIGKECYLKVGKYAIRLDLVESIVDELKEEYTEYCFYEVEKGEKEPTFVEWYDKNIDIHRCLKPVDFKFPGVDYSNIYMYTSELCDESLEILASSVDTYIRHMQQ